MFLRAHVRKKNGKPHRYFSVVENRRLADGRSTQRQVLYLGEINDSQEAAWRKTLEVFDARRERTETLALFPEDRPLPPDALNAIHVRLDQMRLERPRCFGDCWLGQVVWRLLGKELSRQAPKRDVLRKETRRAETRRRPRGKPGGDSRAT